MSAPAPSSSLSTPPSTLAGLLDAGHAALLQRRVSVIVGTRDAALVPHLMRATGYRIDAAAGTVTLLLCAVQAGDTLADIAVNQAIAVVFSEPTTHQTLQLKGFDARHAPVQADDAARVAAYRETLADELGEIGIPRDLIVGGLLNCSGGNLVAVTFTPTLAFRQTPGAHAGERIGSGAP